MYHKDFCKLARSGWEFCSNWNSGVPAKIRQCRDWPRSPKAGVSESFRTARIEIGQWAKSDNIPVWTPLWRYSGHLGGLRDKRKPATEAWQKSRKSLATRTQSQCNVQTNGGCRLSSWGLSSRSPPSAPLPLFQAGSGDLQSAVPLKTVHASWIWIQRNLGYKFHLKLKYNVSGLRSIFAPSLQFPPKASTQSCSPKLQDHRQGRSYLPCPDKWPEAETIAAKCPGPLTLAAEVRISRSQTLLPYSPCVFPLRSVPAPR